MLKNRKARVVLPIAKPSLDSYPRHAYLLAALETSPSAKAWVMSNYLQLSAVRVPDKLDVIGLKDHFFDFVSPDLERNYHPNLSVVQRMTRDLISSLEIDPLRLFREAISSGFYLMVPVDEYFIPNTLGYNRKVRFPHMLMVYGYDDAEDCFHIAGYFKRQFGSRTIPSAVLAEAYAAMEVKYWYLSDVFMYKLQNREPYEFDPIAVAEGIEDYLECRNTWTRYRAYHAPFDGEYGVACYDVFCEYIEKFVEDKNVRDARPAHVLFEHKKIMLQRLQYMSENGHLRDTSILNEYKSVFDLAYKLQLAYLRLHFAKDRGVAESIKKMTQTLQDVERPILEGLLETLKRAHSTSDKKRLSGLIQPAVIEESS